MKNYKIFSMLIIIFFILAFPIITFADEKSDVEVNLKRSIYISSEDKKEPIYTSKSPKNITVLPQTGEIISSFIIILIGLLILLFIVGIQINKYKILDISLET